VLLSRLSEKPLTSHLVLQTLRSFVNDIKKLISINPHELNITAIPDLFDMPTRIIEFISILPDNYNPQTIERLIDRIETFADEKFSKTNSYKRQLAAFDSYFLFEDILNDYWERDITVEERLFYFPVFFWWKVSGVIPLRPREFLITPRNCLSKKEDGWYITLRRDNLKGSEKKTSYKIEDDYYSVTYMIPSELAMEINKYIELTNKYDCTEIETLLVSDTHYAHWNQSKRSNSRFFTYVNLQSVLRYFFNDVIKGKYHLKIVNDRTDTHLENGQINYLYLGDTRHIALINIIAEGGGPVIAMMLAGHDNLETATHYYTNIKSLIECNTYKQYRKVLNGKVSYSIIRTKKSSFGIKEFSRLENGGKCYSPQYLANDYSDCIAISGPEGEIGYCPNCFYYRKEKQVSFFDDDNIYKRKIEDDCKYLVEIVKQVRLEKGNSEDILQALLRLQSSSFSYQQYCREKANIRKGK